MSLDRSFNRSGHCMAKKKSSGIANAVVPASRKKSRPMGKTKITIADSRGALRPAVSPRPRF